MIREYVQNYKCLMTAPHMVPVPVENFYSHEEEDNYNYENANDSLYCCRNNVSRSVYDFESYIVSDGTFDRFLGCLRMI